MGSLEAKGRIARFGVLFLLMLPILVLWGVVLVSVFIGSIKFNSRAPFELYAQVFGSGIYTGSFFVSFYASLIVSFCVLFLCFFSSLWLFLQSFRRVDLVLLAILISSWTSFLVRLYGIEVLSSDYGIVNWVLHLGGYLKYQPVPLLYNLFSTVFGLVQYILPFAFILMFSSFRLIDSNVVRTAQSLGAGQKYVLLKVILPLTLPGIAVTGLLSFIVSFGAFVTPAILGGLNQYMIGMAIGDAINRFGSIGLASALSIALLLLLAIPVVLFIILFVRKKLSWEFL